MANYQRYLINEIEAINRTTEAFGDRYVSFNQIGGKLRIPISLPMSMRG